MIDTAMTMITTVGFPIACVIFMALFVREQLSNHKEEMREQAERHKEETDKMTEAINNNNVILSQILEHMRKRDDERI